ncbi:MAG: hypothetical protein ACOX6G_04075 [Christensenellales bacterium]|jgi:hypothetical protein|nr:hypothetical protein [Clostridiales bacterium]
MNASTLTVPAEKKWSLVLRTTAAAAGALAGLSLDLIDDLRIAIDESFDLLTNQRLALESITMVCTPLENALSISLFGKRSKTGQDCKPLDPETSRLVIGSLVAEINLEGDGCGVHTVVMSLPLCGLRYEC